jgi:PAS domain S-box-containing protein
MTDEREPIGPDEAVAARAVDEFGFDMSRDLVCTANSSGYYVSLNAGWERLLGWTREELMARPFIEFVHPDDVASTARAASGVTQPDAELVDFENRYRCRDGSYRWLRWSARSDGETWFAVAFDISEQKETERRLRGALTDDYLLAYSQPIVDQRLGSVAQQELLVRMRGREGERRVLTPAEFLPDAERCGLIGIVDRWMIARGLALVRGGRPAEINLSARSIDDEELATELVEELGRVGGAAASKLVFEITETAAVEHLDAARAFTERLCRLGCRFALDDFGTGFGSLTYLRDLPVHYLKIDRTFVTDATRSASSRAVVRAVVAMAKELDVLTVAEGIEDATTLQLLRDYGIDYVQGYLIGAPAPLTG